MTWENGRSCSQKSLPEIHGQRYRRRFTRLLPVSTTVTAETKTRTFPKLEATFYPERASLVAQLVKNPPTMRETWV